MINFDGHSDILTHVTIKRLEGENNVFKRYHLERLQKGNVKGAILVVWVDPPYTDDPTWRMMQVLGALSEEIEDMKDCAGIVYRYDDMVKIRESGKIAVVLGMEGMSGLRGNVSLINVLYRLGIRHGMLTWNEENEFATGVGSPNTDRGLTPLGIEAVRRMEELGMIVDVSHANEKTFWDIYENTEKPFIASHSNVYNLCRVPRNLKDDQIKAIAERGGVIGINAWPAFIDEVNPSIENLVRHVDYIADLVGIDYVGFGFDFCEFLTEETTATFQGGKTSATRGLEDASKIPNFVELLAKSGYSERDIEKIAYGNMERVIKEIL
ncbi:dipeptidase [Thermoanaerobacterium sp. DL9XJH110]|uniref:dipeptidase n=1 Tax=Thermoanaerobacterium sp. DL9XJH110 TaxID=3386643 RepID=UPI003BB75EEB